MQLLGTFTFIVLNLILWPDAEWDSKELAYIRVGLHTVSGEIWATEFRLSLHCLFYPHM